MFTTLPSGARRWARGFAHFIGIAAVPGALTRPRCTWSAHPSGRTLVTCSPRPESLTPGLLIGRVRSDAESRYLVTGPAPAGAHARERGRRLGHAVRRARTERGWSRAHLAEQAGVPVGTLARLETEGAAGPSFFAVADLARALQLSLSDLDELCRPAAGLVSVGYEGRDLDGFVRELSDAAVTMVADVRLTPLSRKPGFSKTRLGERLGEAGIDYRHLRPLGNPKENRPPFWQGRIEEGRARFRSLLEAPEAVSALAELAGHAERERVAVLCFERDEHRCHRKVVLDTVRDLARVPVTLLA